MLRVFQQCSIACYFYKNKRLKTTQNLLMKRKKNFAHFLIQWQFSCLMFKVQDWQDSVKFYFFYSKH